VTHATFFTQTACIFFNYALVSYEGNFIGMGFYTFDGPIGCKETATAFYFDLLSNNEYTIYYRRNNEHLFQDWIEILKETDTTNVIERLSFMEFYYKLDELISSGYILNNGWGSFPTSGICFYYENLLEFKISLRTLGRREKLMSYRNDQKKWAQDLLPDFLRAEGNGEIRGKSYPFVLKKTLLNLWDGIREDAISYFKENGIPWWEGTNDGPTGHLVSSQVACINHLFSLRQRKDLATAVLRQIDKDIISAERLDDGFVEFEVIGKKNYLGELQHTRGANSTSIDAVMLGRKAKKNILISIEWKYTENYTGECLYKEPRYKIYNPLLDEPNSPIDSEIAKGDKPDEYYKALYYEPFYQLMRQTLLSCKMVDVNEYGADDYIHLHIVPDENIEMLEGITSNDIQGFKDGDHLDMETAWMAVLKDRAKYKRISPKDFFEPLKEEKDVKSLLQYLEKRYWQ
jgi:hypothetical protein